MKVIKVVLTMVLLCVSVVGFADKVLVQDTFSSSTLYGWMPVAGNWKVMNGKLVQTDTKETLSMLTGPVYQYGNVQYEFDAAYIAGGEDNYAGFGLHICVNGPSKNRSWGNGKSLLLWVTYDPDAYGWPGAFVQVYQSGGPTDMDLYPSGDILKDGGNYPINADAVQWVLNNMDVVMQSVIPVKIRIDTRTGKGRVYDPFNPDKYYFPFDLGTSIMPGSYAAIRMNSLSMSIDNVKITQMD